MQNDQYAGIIRKITAAISASSWTMQKSSKDIEERPKRERKWNLLVQVDHQKAWYEKPSLRINSRIFEV